MNEQPPITSRRDDELLRLYSQEASAEAFAELVRRHLQPVYGGALRRVYGDHALAEDVTQTVFADFARKAAGIPREMPVGGWLHRHTGFVASRLVDREKRRRHREEQAAAMNAIPTNTTSMETAWTEVAPLLDEALDALPSGDRDALVLRFFEQKDFKTVGAALGLSDDSAQKRVARALDKLRAFLSRRGVVSTSGALASLLVVGGVGTAPRAAAAEISSQALAAAAVSGRGLAAALAGLSTAARWKAAGACLAVVCGAAWVGKAVLRAPAVPQVLTASKTAPLPEANTAAAPPAPAAATEPTAPSSVKPTTAALIAAATAEWTTNKGVAATARALALLIQIPAEEMPAALDLANAVNDQPVKSLLLTHLLSLFSETQAPAALAWVEQHPQPNRVDLTQGIFNAWASHDPNATFKIASKTGSAQTLPVTQRMTATLFCTMARQDIHSAFARLESIHGLNDRSQALRGILETVRTDADREEIFRILSTLPNAEIRIQARRAAVEQWAGVDPAAAAAYVEKAEPAWERTRLMDSLGLTWMQDKPAVAAAWWKKHAPGPDTLVKIINVWVQQDPNAAGLWLQEQPPGPASDSARMTFARQVSDLDPESALRWAETVSDETMRESTIDTVYANWQSRDATAAQQFLTKSAWPAARQQRIKTNNPSTQSQP